MKSLWITISAMMLLSANLYAATNSESVKQALESAPSCANFTHYDEHNTYIGFGNYRNGYEEPRSPIPSTVVVTPIVEKPAPSVLNTADAAIDSVSNGDSLFVLTYSGIEEWNLTTQARTAIYPTYMIGGTRAYMEHAQAFARYQNKMIIAHGRLGVSFFDLNSKRITNQFRLVQSQLPLESMATGVAVQGKYAYVVMDNFSLKTGTPAFRGIIVINMDTEKVERELDGLDPGADGITADANSVIVSFGGEPVWKYALASLQGSKLPEPVVRVWKFVEGGHPVGHAVMDDTYYYTCYLKTPAKPGGAYRLAPSALNRKQLLLD